MRNIFSGKRKKGISHDERFASKPSGGEGNKFRISGAGERRAGLQFHKIACALGVGGDGVPQRRERREALLVAHADNEL